MSVLPGLRRSGLAVVLALGLLAGGASAVHAFTPPGSGPTGALERAELDRHIVQALPARLADPRLGPDVAIRVGSADGSDVLFSRQSGVAQMPASNMKLVTALGALTSLGPTHELTTRVAALDAGGLVLVGGGDPLLSSSDLDRLAADVVAKTLPAPGAVQVYVSDRYFRDGSLAPGWRGSYVPGEVTYVRSLGRHGVLVRDTAADAGRYLADRLSARGLKAVYVGRGRGANSPVAEVSHTVAQAVAVMLRDSDNQVAETLFRHVGLAGGHPPSWAGGSAAARDVLESHGISTSGLRIYDGSGLSRSDRLTARSVEQLLVLAGSGSVPELSGLVGWLPVAGRTGTLGPYSGRYTTRPSRCAAGLVRAKTGTLTGALALSGFAYGEDGSRRAFSILVNHPPTDRYSVLTVRRAMDGLAATLTGCW